MLLCITNDAIIRSSSSCLHGASRFIMFCAMYLFSALHAASTVPKLVACLGWLELLAVGWCCCCFSCSCSCSWSCCCWWWLLLSFCRSEHPPDPADQFPGNGVLATTWPRTALSSVWHLVGQKLDIEKKLAGKGRSKCSLDSSAGVRALELQIQVNSIQIQFKSQ